LDANGKSLSVSFDPKQPYLHILHLDTMQINHSLPAPSKPVTWSPNSRQFIYRTSDDNVAVMDVSNGRSTPVTFSGGARLSAPQWSFDGRYLSMRVAGPEWGTAVLRVP
jgi:Tol biopolymer transport system component